MNKELKELIEKGCNIVLSGAADRILYKNFLNKIIGIVQEMYFN